MITISGCLIIKNNKLLLLHRKDKDQWEVPGGTIKPGESPEQTAIREVKEEIGCNVKIIGCLCCFEFTFNNKKHKSYCFLAKITKGKPKIIEKETFDKLEFIPLDKLKQQKIAPNVGMAVDNMN